MAGLSVPAYFVAAANANPTSSTVTLSKALTAFPQYSGVTDLWGSNSANFTYHSLQITLLQRMAHGLNFNINYTYSKNIGDDGTFRSGFNIPAAALTGGGQNWHQDRITGPGPRIRFPMRSAAGRFRWQRPPGGNSWAGRNLAGGWQFFREFNTYSSGTPMAVTSNLCTGTNFPNQGQCMPHLTPGATSARLGGSFGTGSNWNHDLQSWSGLRLVPVTYVDSSKFRAPGNISAISGSPMYLIGNAPRTQALNLRNPGTQDLDAALHRSFALPKEWASRL